MCSSFTYAAMSITLGRNGTKSVTNAMLGREGCKKASNIAGDLPYEFGEVYPLLAARVMSKAGRLR